MTDLAQLLAELMTEEEHELLEQAATNLWEEYQEDLVEEA